VALFGCCQMFKYIIIIPSPSVMSWNFSQHHHPTKESHLLAHWSSLQQSPFICSFWESWEMLRIVQNKFLCPLHFVCVCVMGSDRTAQYSQVSESFISIATMVSDSKFGHICLGMWASPLLYLMTQKERVNEKGFFHSWEVPFLVPRNKCAQKDI
jgi:hypothetical protein